MPGRHAISVKQLNAHEFLATDFAGRMDLVKRTCGLRLWSSQLSVIWADMIDQATVRGLGGLPAFRQLLRELMILDPESDAAEQSYRRFVDAGALPGESSPTKIVHLVVSCDKYLGRARALYAELSSALQPAFIVVGDGSLGEAAWTGELLRVPAPDNYESLPHKVLEAFLAVRRRFGAVAILKIDDDSHFTGPADRVAVDALLGSVDYAGVPAGATLLDRCWHIGKCEHHAIPYSRRLRGSWANGPLYFLGPRAVDCLVRDYLCYPGEILGEIFEDKLVGDLLRSHAIPITPMDLRTVFGITWYQEPDPEAPTVMINWRSS
jgi:hypothetical protein